MDGRKIQRARQEAWKQVSQEWKDDPELCFAMGFSQGYKFAVAQRSEPPVTESGEGFESLPAKPAEPVAWMVKLPDGSQFVYDGRMLEYIDPDIHATRQLLYTAPPQRKPLTDAEIEKLMTDTWGFAPQSVPEFARLIERAHGIGGDV